MTNHREAALLLRICAMRAEGWVYFVHKYADDRFSVWTQFTAKAMQVVSAPYFTTEEEAAAWARKMSML